MSQEFLDLVAKGCTKEQARQFYNTKIANLERGGQSKGFINTVKAQKNEILGLKKYSDHEEIPYDILDSDTSCKIHLKSTETLFRYTNKSKFGAKVTEMYLIQCSKIVNGDNKKIKTIKNRYKWFIKNYHTNKAMSERQEKEKNAKKTKKHHIYMEWYQSQEWDPISVQLISLFNLIPEHDDNNDNNDIQSNPKKRQKLQ